MYHFIQNCQRFPIENLRRVWTYDRGCSGHLVPSHLGLAYVPLVETNPFSGTCRYFSGLCTSNIPRYFLDFSWMVQCNLSKPNLVYSGILSITDIILCPINSMFYYFNLYNPDPCLNWPNSLVPKRSGLDKLHCISITCIGKIHICVE